MGSAHPDASRDDDRTSCCMLSYSAMDRLSVKASDSKCEFHLTQGGYTRHCEGTKINLSRLPADERGLLLELPKMRTAQSRRIEALGKFSVRQVADRTPPSGQNRVDVRKAI